jgi:hypothetical protein
VATLQRVGAGTELVVVARPAVDVEGEIGARAFIVQGGQVRETEARAQVAASGSVELRVRPADGAQGATGPASLRIVVGRPGTIRAVTGADAQQAADAGPDARWLTVPLELLGG